MLRISKRMTKLLQVRWNCVKSREEMEIYLSQKLEEGLKYLEKMQMYDNTEEGKEDIIKGITRCNYVSKYFLCNALQIVSTHNLIFKNDENFKVIIYIT